MDFKKALFQLLLGLLLPVLSHADSTVTITLKNQSSYTLEFKRAVHREGSRFTIEPQIINPNTTAIITGTITADVDLAGQLYFNDGVDYFKINDRRLKHYGQPIFVMQSQHVKSIVESQTFNTSKNPLELSYIAATVILHQR